MTETATTPTTDVMPYTLENGTIVHLELLVNDLEAASSFYGDLFDWQFQSFGDDELYFETPGTGPCGMLVEGTPVVEDATVLFVNVDSIEDTLEQAVELDAEIITPKTEIEGGHGWFAKIQSPVGNVLGLYWNDK